MGKLTAEKNLETWHLQEVRGEWMRGDVGLAASPWEELTEDRGCWDSFKNHSIVATTPWTRQEWYLDSTSMQLLRKLGKCKLHSHEEW